MYTVIHSMNGCGSGTEYALKFDVAAMNTRACVGSSPAGLAGRLDAGHAAADMDLFASAADCLAGTNRVAHYEFEVEDAKLYDLDASRRGACTGPVACACISAGGYSVSAAISCTAAGPCASLAVELQTPAAVAVGVATALTLRATADVPHACTGVEFSWVGVDAASGAVTHDESHGTEYGELHEDDHISSLFVAAGSVTEDTVVLMTVTANATGCAPSAFVCPGNRSATVAVSRGLDPLTVHLTGGTFRTVGRADSFTLSAVASVAAAAHSWACVDERSGATVVGQATGLLASLTLRGADLHPSGSASLLVNCTVVVALGDGRQATASTEVQVEPGSPPSVLISSTAHGKVNPSARLVLLGRITASDGSTELPAGAALDLVWLAQRYPYPTGSAAPVSVVLQTTTGLAAQNLVLPPAELEPGGRYRFRLSATTADGLTGIAAMDVLVNRPPARGVLVPSPAAGMAVVDVFSMRAVGFSDEDLPVSHRFGTISALSAVDFLNDFSLSDTLTSVLPAGSPARGFNVTLVVGVQDGLGAETFANASVAVQPYRPPANVNLSGARVAHL